MEANERDLVRESRSSLSRRNGSYLTSNTSQQEADQWLWLTPGSICGMKFCGRSTILNVYSAILTKSRGDRTMVGKFRPKHWLCVWTPATPFIREMLLFSAMLLAIHFSSQQLLTRSMLRKDLDSRSIGIKVQTKKGQALLHSLHNKSSLLAVRDTQTRYSKRSDRLEVSGLVESWTLLTMINFPIHRQHINQPSRRQPRNALPIGTMAINYGRN